MTALIKAWTLPLFVGVCLGWVLDALDADVVLWGLFDDAFPVVSMRAETSRDEQGRYLVRVSGTKYRACDFDSLWAYDVGPLKTRTRLVAQRIDGASNATHPLGAFASGTPWVVIPPPTGRLEIWTRHLCGRRPVMTQAEVQ